MRVISGKHRGIKLNPPLDQRVRPTTDRIKETIFNILCNKVSLDGALVLDLFAGSGALGIESISRGADKCVFIDKDADSVKIIKSNAKKLKQDEGKCEIYNVTYDFALKKLSGRKFDIIFVDPPYALHIEQKIVELIEKFEVLSDDGVIVIEHDTQNALPNFIGFTIDAREMGNTSVSFLSRK